MAVAGLLSACKKDKTSASEQTVPAATGLRLVHSSYVSNATPVDLYVDDAKLTASGAISFFNASGYFPLTAGSRKISARTTAGVVVADTIINIVDGKQYSFFIKDRSWVDPVTTVVSTLKTGLAGIVDNSTSAPLDGMAKVRFVNTSSLPLNASLAQLTFVQIKPADSVPATVTITQTLSGLLVGSEYASFPAGQITIRTYGATSSGAVLDPTYNVEITTTLEAGKLYTLFAVSTPYTIKTLTKAPYAVKLLTNN